MVVVLDKVAVNTEFSNSESLLLKEITNLDIKYLLKFLCTLSFWQTADIWNSIMFALHEIFAKTRIL
jgi:hypothetical protein